MMEGLLIRLLWVIALCLIAWAAVVAVQAHEWYDRDCCDTRDCAPISQTQVEWVPDRGWHVVGEDRCFSLNSYNFRPSQDNGWHRCTTSSGLTRCLYHPDPGL